MRKHKGAIAYLITIVVGMLLFCMVFSMRDIGTLTEQAELYSALCDAFFVPGILLTCAGILALVSTSGQFDMLSFAGHFVITLFTPFTKRESRMKYYEYKQMKEAHRTAPRPFLLIVGGGYLLLAAFCLILYMTA